MMIQTSAQILAEELSYEQTTFYKGFTVAHLRTVFDALCDPLDWKAPLAALVPGEAVIAACAAIEFFTATQPAVTLNTRTMSYLVESQGYRHGPAGDH